MKRVNRHRWLFEPLEDLPTFEARRMFGSLAGYFNGLLVLVLCDGDEPWRGVLVPTERESHAALIAEFPALASHPILGKWLYLPESTATFERDAQKIVERIRRLDPRFGVLPERDRPKKSPPSAGVLSTYRTKRHPPSHESTKNSESRKPGRSRVSPRR